MKQKTISQKFSLQGIGLHTGVDTVITCRPAEPNTGIVFRRMDDDEQTEIPSSLHLVDSTFRSTSLKKGDKVYYRRAQWTRNTDLGWKCNTICRSDK